MKNITPSKHIDIRFAGESFPSADLVEKARPVSDMWPLSLVSVQNADAADLPPVPSPIEPYVKVLGVVGAIEIFMSLGGSKIYLSKTTTKKLKISDLIGDKKQVELAVALGRGVKRLPLPKIWIAQCMFAFGVPLLDISRSLHRSLGTVQQWCNINALSASDVSLDIKTLPPATGNYPRAPAHIEPYVRVLGVAGAIDVFMSLGGAEIHMTSTPVAGSKLTNLIGFEKQAALGALLPNGKQRVPIPKFWIAECMSIMGHTTAEIARKFHTTDSTVRRWRKANDKFFAAKT